MRIRDGKIQIRDAGWKKVGSGIRDKHPGSAPLIFQRKKVNIYLKIFFQDAPKNTVKQICPETQMIHLWQASGRYRYHAYNNKK
jgi:hypothetical protein